MHPDDPRNNGRAVPQRQFLRPVPDTQDSRNNSQDAAANVARTQLDALYGGRTTTPTPQTTPVTHVQQPIVQQSIEFESPYDRTQTNTADVEADQWKHYHSAWQDYYQKYYERYYIGQVYRAKQDLESLNTQQSTMPTQLFSKAQEETTGTEIFNRDEALFDLRSKLVGKIQKSAGNVRKSRHFIPIAAAACVVLLFLFLQYNRVLFANVQAYVSPGNINPANIIVDPSTSLVVSPEPKLIIPKINVDVPVDYNTQPTNDSQMKAMENGVAYFGIPGASSKPGQIGNTVLSGHSSNDIIDQGSYKFIFARLDQLEQGDTIFVNYNSKRYTYSITKKEVVSPTEVSKLVYPTDKPVLTLITCTPLGTSLNRLLVTADQISPSPSEAESAPPVSTRQSTVSIPGNSPTFLQRIFGGGQ